MTLSTALNGRPTIDKQEIEGLTAIATDTKENEPGPITLQGDYGPIAFRSIVVTPLVRQDWRKRDSCYGATGRSFRGDGQARCGSGPRRRVKRCIRSNAGLADSAHRAA